MKELDFLDNEATNEKILLHIFVPSLRLQPVSSLLELRVTTQPVRNPAKSSTL